jgi:hypothetical protein
MKSACLIAAVCCLVISCGPFKKAQRVEPDATAAKEDASRSETVADRSAEWSAANARRLAREMMTDCLSGAWIPAYLGVTGNQPLATVGPVHDWTGQGIDTQPMVKSCEQELSKSEQVSFMVCQSRSEEPDEEGADKQEFVSPETIKRIKSETRATFILVGAVRSIDDKTEAGSPPYYQVELEMVNTKTLARVWSGIGKIGE